MQGELQPVSSLVHDTFFWSLPLWSFWQHHTMLRRIWAYSLLLWPPFSWHLLLLHICYCRLPSLLYNNLWLMIPLLWVMSVFCLLHLHYQSGRYQHNVHKGDNVTSVISSANTSASLEILRCPHRPWWDLCPIQPGSHLHLYSNRQIYTLGWGSSSSWFTQFSVPSTLS